tara:strand:+ start:775 stop:1014 length:240 start_codon:yes stop_codon:yes gene_type:complete
MFVYSDHITNKKAFEPKYINKIYSGGNHQMFIYESIGNKDMYGVEVLKLTPQKKQVYAHGRLSATKAVEVAGKYNIELK